MRIRRLFEPMQDEHVNVTPLIDIVMCLIIFFLICGKLAHDENSAEIQIPEAQTGADLHEPRDRLVVNLAPRGGNAHEAPDIMIRGQVIPIEKLAGYLRTQAAAIPDLKLVLRADKDLEYQYIAPVLMACAEAHIKTVNYATQKP